MPGCSQNADFTQCPETMGAFFTHLLLAGAVPDTAPHPAEEGPFLTTSSTVSESPFFDPCRLTYPFRRTCTLQLSTLTPHTSDPSSVFLKLRSGLAQRRLCPEYCAYAPPLDCGSLVGTDTIFQLRVTIFQPTGLRQEVLGKCHLS